MKKRLLLTILLASGMLGFTGVASASVCSPSAAGAIVQSSIQDQQMDAKNEQAASDNFLSKISSSLDSIGCTDAWPTGSIGFSLPSYDTILRKAKEAAISKACGLAREKVSEAMGNISNQVSLNTSNIPGINELGLGSIGGGLSTGTGSSAGGSVSLNGSSVSTSDIWNSISGAVK
jgi:hypothetical protein